MSLTELKAFDAVARGGGFARAAELLGRAQPTVTAQVRNLEQRYGIQLFFRTRGHTARLTPVGERLFETTRQLFNLERDAEALMRAAGNMKGGSLRVGAISPRWATGIVSHMVTSYPLLDLDLTIANSKRLLDMVIEFQVDVAFLGTHVPNPACHMQLVSRPEIVLIAGLGHPSAETGVVSREMFARQTLLHREIGSETRALIDEQLSAHKYRPGRTVVLGNRDGVLLAAEQNLGLAPCSLEEIPSGARVRVVRAEDFRVFGEIHAVCLKSRFHLPIIRESFDLLSGPP